MQFSSCRSVRIQYSGIQEKLVRRSAFFASSLLLERCLSLDTYIAHRYFIDVSQSVENNHPMALEFLRMDCKNMTDFWKRKHGVATVPVQDLFFFITTDSFRSQEEVDDALERLISAAEASRRGEGDDIGDELAAQKAVDESVFMQTTIPRSLTEIGDEEELHRRLQQGDNEKAFETVVSDLRGETRRLQEDATVEHFDEASSSQPAQGEQKSEGMSAEEARLAEIMAKLKKWENRVAITAQNDNVNSDTVITAPEESNEHAGSNGKESGDDSNSR